MKMFGWPMLIVLPLWRDGLLAVDVDCQRDVAPILQQRCQDCHGETEAESGLRLDLRAAMLSGADSGRSVVVPGKPVKNCKLEVINHVDADRLIADGSESVSSKISIRPNIDSRRPDVPRIQISSLTQTNARLLP